MLNFNNTYRRSLPKVFHERESLLTATELYLGKRAMTPSLATRLYSLEFAIVCPDDAPETEREPSPEDDPESPTSIYFDNL